VAGHGLLGMRVDTTMILFFVRGVGDNHVLGSQEFWRYHLSDILVKHGDLLFSLVLFNIFPCNEGQFFLYFNGGDAKIWCSQAQNQGDNAAATADVHDFIPGAWLGMGREYKGIHGESVPILGLANVELSVKKIFSCAGRQF